MFATLYRYCPAHGFSIPLVVLTLLPIWLITARLFSNDENSSTFNFKQASKVLLFILAVLAMLVWIPVVLLVSLGVKVYRYFSRDPSFSADNFCTSREFVVNHDEVERYVENYKGVFYKEVDGYDVSTKNYNNNLFITPK